MITPDEVIDLLTFAAVFDQRTAGPEDVAGWLAVGQAQGWTFPAARRAITDHYGSGADKPRITPARITDAIRKIRSAAADTFEDPRVPDDLRGVDYPTWYRQQRDAHTARCLAEWAATGEQPKPRAVEPLGDGLAAMIARAPERVRPALEASVEHITERRA